MTQTAKKHQLVLSVFQAAILCLFNDSEEMTCGEVLAVTRVQKKDFMACMMKICHPTSKVLLYNGKKPVFNEDEKLKVNPKFTSPAVRITLVPTRNHKKKEAGATEEEKGQMKQINKERTFVAQSHIVKVMKAHKKHRYVDLQRDVMQNITMFNADPKMIKD